ncbi:RHOMBOID-like protein 10, chloroplastic isoform X2 [Senna tora]|uniref:RHOMBOID-like protein 10, chloroplastic isoform X2 n=1 Tax=Senna tora TaxID=362788 RepID=A0A834XAF7_9FABA|nr:RHOMBOID-like protein 10, chloroplastic isoform X2 [Senna tora]
MNLPDLIEYPPAPASETPLQREPPSPPPYVTPPLYVAVATVHRRRTPLSPFQIYLRERLPPLNHVIRLKDVWCERSLQLKEINFLQLSNDVSTCLLAANILWVSACLLE